MATRLRLLIGGIAFSLLAVVLNVSVCQSAEDPSRPEMFPAPLAKMELDEGDTLVFLGDSITHQCLYTQYVEDFFYTRFPAKRIRFHNAGVGGAKAWDALQRFDRDVADYKPKYVTVLLGMNDGRYQPFKQEIFDTYQNDMREVIDRIKQTGAQPILMSPTMFDSRAARLRRPNDDPGKLELYNSVLAYYGQWLREVSMRNGYGFVDMYSPLNNLTLLERKTEPRFTMIPDSVHPGPSGQIVMAYSIIEDMGLRKPLSNIRILSGPGGKSRAQVSGGKIEDLKKTDTGVEFTFTADALPWVLPEEAAAGVKMLHLGHRASREALEIHDLDPGQYELQIDGESVGVFSATQLARHVELQENPRTPQHKQALKVAELNKERNGGPVRSLRNIWSIFQAHARSAQTLKENPNNETLEKQVAKTAERLKNMDKQIRQHEAAAKNIEDQIYSLNQPQPRHYVLKPVKKAQVSGRVTLNGRPVANANIRFHGQNLGLIGNAKTDQAGNYHVRSNNTPGLVPGTYRITIASQKAQGNNGRLSIPEKFAQPQTTQLTVNVVEGKNDFRFDLVSEQ